MEDQIGHWDWFQQVLNAHLFFMSLEKWNDFTAFAGFKAKKQERSFTFNSKHNLAQIAVISCKTAALKSGQILIK